MNIPDTYQANFERQHRRLKAAQKTGNAQTVRTVAVEGLASFERHGYPDQWSDWQRAADDADLAIRYGRKDQR